MYKGAGNVVNRIAQALADQRARYEAVADELDDYDREIGFDEGPDYWSGVSDVTRRIRQVSRG